MSRLRFITVDLKKKKCRNDKEIYLQLVYKFLTIKLDTSLITGQDQDESNNFNYSVSLPKLTQFYDRAL